jgi:hypothetical protein
MQRGEGMDILPNEVLMMILELTDNSIHGLLEMEKLVKIDDCSI